MPLPDSIQHLIENFAANRTEYHKGHYNETQTRIDYVNPLFAALGWDMDNAEGLSELHRDVIHEDMVKIGGHSKAPDYSFRAGGERKFFVETKKPSVNLYLLESPAFQIRRYAWTVKMPLSILTNFEEFAVYDTRVRPDQKDAAKTARLEHFKYTDYAEKWDALTARFSRDAVLSGAFDKYAAEARDKRISVPVDQAFLAEISGWREKLARNIVQNNPGLGPRELNYAVQMIIDRLIFLRISEDRGAEPDFLLHPLVNKGGAVYPRLLDVFRRADARYNSGLFHFEPDPKREGPDDITPHLTIDDRPLREIIASVYYPESPFEFSVFPADILGQVYEQFLGKVIRVSGKTAEVEEKPEVKKAGGVYYTPTYIVDYIVKNTVGKLVEGRTPAQVAKLSILDPACGSGSFLIGAYQFLLDWHLKYYLDHDKAKAAKGKNAVIYLFKKDPALGEIWRLTTAEKKRILLNNIYGVDIDTQAVEVSKLSLLLKVLEGESAELIDNTLKFLHERALPDLEHNIKCGNSLIGPDFYTDKDMALFDMDALLKINTFDWNTGFPQVMKSGGFDAVIGNPPYVFARNKGFTEDEKLFYLQHFKHQSYQLNTFSIFLEQGFNLLKTSGFLGYIIPNNWLSISTMKRLRDFVMTSTSNVEIVNNLYKVFSGANVDTSILTFRRDKPSIVSLVESIAPADYKHIADVSPLDLLANQIIQFKAYTDLRAKKVVDTVEENSVQLQSVALVKAGLKAYETGKGQPAQTDEMKHKRIYHQREKVDDSYRVYLDGKDVKRYSVSWSGQYLKYGVVLAAPRDKNLFDGPRILVRQIPSHPPYSINAVVVSGDELNDINSMIVKPTAEYSIHFILGVLNSRLLTFWFANKFDKMQRGIFPQFKVNELATFPIRTIDFAKPAEKALHDKMVGLVERMLELHQDKAPARLATEKNMLQVQIEAVDRQIDALVYTLYGLTEDEIAVVEGTAGAGSQNKTLGGDAKSDDQGSV